MIQKTQKQAFENLTGHHDSKEEYLKREVLSFLQYKILGLDKGLLIPDRLIAETEAFMERNTLPDADYQCCPTCIKAHVMRKAREFGLTNKEIDYLDIIFEGEIGHEGYYLDAEKLIRI